MKDHQFEILIDGACPLCRREAKLLGRLDRGRGRLKITDISDSAFNASDYGITFADAMGTIHGVQQDGELVSGMEVFRQAYRVVGLGWFMAPTGWPLFRAPVDLVYRLFSRHRLRLTGHCVDDRCVANNNSHSCSG